MNIDVESAFVRGRLQRTRLLAMLGRRGAEEDLRVEKWSLKKQLTPTVHQIWQNKALAAGDDELKRWFDNLNAEMKPRDRLPDAYGTG